MEKSLRGGHGNPLQYSCLKNPHGQRIPAVYSPWGCKVSDTTEQISITAHGEIMQIILVDVITIINILTFSSYFCIFSLNKKQDLDESCNERERRELGSESDSQFCSISLCKEIS